ncbi:MAG: stage III sporulation protein AE [Eubacteriales bacterium]|nr:stage III sporulation protein AE [Eubacteriales bacterium]
MRKRILLLTLLLLCHCTAAYGEGLEQGITQAVAQLDLRELSLAAGESELLQGSVGELLQALASGKTVLSPEGVLQWLLSKAAGIFKNSLWRMTRLLVPALLSACAEQLCAGKQGVIKGMRYGGLLMIMGFLVADLKEYVALCNASVGEMAGLMQAIFPLLVTLLAAVGGTASSVFYQPAVMAAAGSMTTLIQSVTMPFAVSVAVLTMAGGLSDSLRVNKLCRLFRQVADWTLGFGFTVFIGVMTVQGLSAAAVDGVSIRTAKYAMDNFIPIVGGMFADTVDTLVGCSLLVQNAVGVLGLLLLLGKILLPLLRTVAAMLLYRATAAVLQPMSDSPLCSLIGEYSEVFSLLFIIQLSVGAMFMLLCAQLLTVGNLTVMLR